MKPPRINNIKKIFYTYVFTLSEFHDESDLIMLNLKKYFKRAYGLVYDTNCEDYFHYYWDGIGYADVIVLNTHSYPEGMFNNLYIQDVRKLRKINCKALIILGCNAGHYTYLWSNIAYEFSHKISGIVLASDGTVAGPSSTNELTYKSVNDKYYREFLPENNKSRKNIGWVLYKTNNVNTTWYLTDMKEIAIPSILDYLQNCGYVKF